MSIVNHFSDRDQLDLICEIVARLKPEVYLELGIKNGHTISSIVPHSNRAIGVDIKKRFKENRGYEFYEMSTDDFFKKVDGGEISLPLINVAFIDANHDKEYVLRDFYNVWGRIEEQGVVILHDTYPKNEQFTQPHLCDNAYEAAWAISQIDDPTMESFTLPVNPGITLIRKRSSQLSWK